MCAWVRSVAFLPDESIYSWIVRAALAQGCDPLTLTGAIWPRWRSWTTDIDRGFNTLRLQSLTKASGVSSFDFEERFLRVDAEKIAGHELTYTGTWPWVLALSMRNRKRLGGMQYCPECFTTDAIPYFRRSWRFAWQTACTKHGILLNDRCWSCNMHVSPHRLVAENHHLGECFNCMADLGLAPKLPSNSLADEFQRNSDAVLTASHVHFNHQLSTTDQWFRLAKFYLGLVRYSVRNEPCRISRALGELGLSHALDELPTLGMPLELLSPSHRSILFEKVFCLMSIEQNNLFGAFKTEGVSLNGLKAISPDLPFALQELTVKLPYKVYGRRRKRVPSKKLRSKRTVSIMWARLLRKMSLPFEEC
jgi:hypothetical protein